MKHVKTIDALMKYLRETHNMNIGGSAQKRKLRNLGYYHGYKGYRFIKTPNNKISFNDFDELMAIANFDIRLKTLIYPQIMFIETALKNYVLEQILLKSRTDNFNKIYNEILTDYRVYKSDSVKYKKAMTRRLSLYNKVYSSITRDFDNDKQVIKHFFMKDKSLPIWAIFEILSLGEFGNFVSCLNKNVKISVSKELKFPVQCDSDGSLTEKIVFTLKDLRNAVAHNDIVFDTRFKNAQIDKRLSSAISIDTAIKDISFKTITDYIILIAYVLKKLCVNKSEILKFLMEYKKIVELLRKEIPIDIFNKIIFTDFQPKYNALIKFIKNQ